MKELQISSSLKEGWLFDTKLTDFFFFSFFFFLYAFCSVSQRPQTAARISGLVGDENKASFWEWSDGFEFVG